MSLKPKKRSSIKKRTTKKKRLTRAQFRVKLRDVAGGWTNEWEGTSARKLLLNQKEYTVTLADRLQVLEYHRKQTVIPMLKHLGIKVKIDKASFLEQEEAYDGRSTDLVYNYKVPKHAQNAMLKRMKRKRLTLGQWDYFDYLRKKHGNSIIKEYLSAEDKALAKTFGKKAAYEIGFLAETIVEDLEIHSFSYVLTNEWRRGGMKD